MKNPFKKAKAKNMPGKDRPIMLSDKLGYPEEVGDKDWEKKHKKNWKKLPDGTWEELN